MYPTRAKIKKGSHQLLLPRLMSSKVFDGAVNVLITRCHWLRPAGADPASDVTSISLMISPLSSRMRLVANLTFSLTGPFSERLHFGGKATNRWAHSRHLQERIAFARDCTLEWLKCRNQFLFIREQRRKSLQLPSALNDLAGRGWGWRLRFLAGLALRLLRSVGLVHRDVETSLLELLLHIDQARLLQRQQPAPHPGHLPRAQALLGNVHRCAGHMGAHHVALGGSGISVGLHELLLVRNGAHR